MELTIKNLGTFYLKVSKHIEEANLTYDSIHATCGSPMNRVYMCRTCNAEVPYGEMGKKYNDKITITKEYADKIKEACIKTSSEGVVVPTAEIFNENFAERVQNSSRRLFVSKGKLKSEKTKRLNDYAMLCAGLKEANACVITNISLSSRSYARQIAIMPDKTGTYLIEVPLWYKDEVKAEPYPEAVVSDQMKAVAGKKIASMIQNNSWAMIDEQVPNTYEQEAKLLEAFENGTLEAQMKKILGSEVVEELTTCNWEVAEVVA